MTKSFKRTKAHYTLVLAKGKFFIKTRQDICLTTNITYFVMVVQMMLLLLFCGVAGICNLKNAVNCFIKYNHLLLIFF